MEPKKDNIEDHLIYAIEFKERRYEISLPWKEFHPPLQDNYDFSLHRLKGLLPKLRRDPQILEQYSTIIQD